MRENNATNQLVKEALIKAKENDVEKRLRAARRIFLILVSVQSFCVYMLIHSYPSAPYSLFAPDFLLIGFFIILFFMSFKFTYRSFLWGLITYVLFNAILAMVSIGYIIRGYSFKIFVLIILISGFIYIWKVRSILKKENVIVH
jgi:hypothetical protein